MRCNGVWFALVLSGWIVSGVVAEDWPQWRGPGRDGVSVGSTRLADAWPKTGPRKLWESEKIPAGGVGGAASVSVAGGRAYLNVNWRCREAIATRALSGKALGQLGGPPKPLPKELAEALEAARLSPQRAKLKGKELNQWAAQWAKDKLTPEQQKPWAGFVRNRLVKGPRAISLEVLAKLAEIRDKTFPTQEALDKWFADNGIAEEVRKRVLAKIPTDVGKANDVILCLGPDGETLWKRTYPSRPVDWGCSGTLSVAEGRCYAVGAGGDVYCLAAETGKEIWVKKRPGDPGKVVHSSIVKVGSAVIVMGSPMSAMGADDGKVLWTQKAASPMNNSPSLWRHAGKTYLICNGTAGKKVACVDAADGKVLWTVPGGGDSSVVVTGDTFVVVSDNKKVGTSAYKMSAKGAKKLWTAAFWDRGASPVVYKGHVYVIVNSNGGRTACIELAKGQVAWDERIGGTEYSSPIVADGKVIAVDRNGGRLLMFKATPERYIPLAEARLSIVVCTSPAVAEGKMYLRLKHAVACYDLQSPSPAAQGKEAP